MNTRAKTLIQLLKLIAHSEGGFYREVFRSKSKVESPAKKTSRHAMSDIYFLLPSGHVSKFHKLAHDELWHFYEGSPVQIIEIEPEVLKITKTTIGHTSEVLCYKHLVKAGNWQAAKTSGDYSLAGCTVAPGFEFEDFKLLRDDQESYLKVIKKHPASKYLI